MNTPDMTQSPVRKTTSKPDAIELEALGNALVKEGRLDEAERTFQQGARHFPDQVVFYERMAHVATRNDQHRKASKIYKHIVDRFSDFSDGYTWYADALLREEKYEDAEKHLLFFQERFPDLPHSYRRFVPVYCENRDFSQALGYCKALHRQSPHYVNCPSSDTNILLEFLFKASFTKAVAHGQSVQTFDAQEQKNEELKSLLLLALLIEEQEKTLKKIGKESSLVQRNAPISSINHNLPKTVSIDVTTMVKHCLTKILQYYIEASFSSSQQSSYVFEDAPTVPLGRPLIGIVSEKPSSNESNNVLSYKNHTALYDKSGRILPRSVYYRFNFPHHHFIHLGIQLPLFKPPRHKSDMVLERESVLFMWACGSDNYGHWMKEGLSAAWHLCSQAWDGKVMFPEPLKHEWQFETLKLLNIPRSRIIHPDRSRVLRHVVIPEPSNVLYTYARERCRDTYRVMARNALRVPIESLSHEAQRALQFDKIYFSRSNRSDKITMRATVGEHELEQVLEDNGFYIFHPHNFTETEKIHIINRAQAMVVNEGSSRYALAYCLHKPKVLVTGHTFADINLQDQLADYSVKFYRYPIFSADNADHWGLCVVNIPAFVEMLKNEGLLS